MRTTFKVVVSLPKKLTIREIREYIQDAIESKSPLWNIKAKVTRVPKAYPIDLGRRLDHD